LERRGDSDVNGPGGPKAEREFCNGVLCEVANGIWPIHAWEPVGWHVRASDQYGHELETKIAGEKFNLVTRCLAGVR